LWVGMLLLTACASIQPKTEPPQSAKGVLLTGPARYFEKSQNKEYRFDIEILGLDGFAKMEVSGLLGLKFATLSESDRVSTAIIHQEKKYFFATNPGVVLQFFIGESLDMRSLVQRLRTGQGSQSVQVSDLGSGKKKLEVKNNKYELVWVYETNPTEVQDRSAVQKMEVPSGYRTYRLTGR
ncbi:MAG TPA: hypothetical protein PLU50_03330, partial [Pseudobdellovibrionaceae bacterium]|nr:hypothetical protein [Pseudobdellovibrionaceae bacterium]